jgi:hypothetical protein
MRVYVVCVNFSTKETMGEPPSETSRLFYALPMYNIIAVYKQYLGVRGSSLCYKPEGRGFETRWGEFFQFT